MGAGAPVGNKNAARAKIWREAVLRALDRRGLDRESSLDELAAQLLNKCAEGDLTALKELGDRLDGKPAQAIIGGNPGDPAMRVVVLSEKDAGI